MAKVHLELPENITAQQEKILDMLNNWNKERLEEIIKTLSSKNIIYIKYENDNSRRISLDHNYRLESEGITDEKIVLRILTEFISQV